MENMDNMEAHYLAMVLIGVGSFVFGILPIVFSFRVTRSYPFFLSLVLCLGAGVLLATSLVHMLTEVQVKLKLSTQLYFCAGFLTLYTFDEISHYCLSSRPKIDSRRERRQNRGDYGATHNSVGFDENSSFLESNDGKNYETLPSEKHFECGHSQCRVKCSDERCKRESAQNLLDGGYLNSENDDHYHVACHTEENWSPNPTAKAGLLIALLIHSILEGVSIGVQTEMSEIMLILGAVTFHKVILSFCLGLELHQQRYKKLQLLVAIFIFSIGSPIGISLGMTVTSMEHEIFGIEAELQAIAAGSLLYVATFEVLPRERFKWQKSNKTGAGIFQLIFLLIGFTLITVFHFYVDPSSSPEKHSNVTRKIS